MRLALTDAAKAAVANTSPAQVWAFVCSSRQKDAEIVAAHISFETAKREARKIGGCMRVGRVVGQYAETI